MRLLIRHSIGLLIFLFMFRLAVQIQYAESSVELPKAVLLSRLAAEDPFPSRISDKRNLLKTIAAESERFIDRKHRGAYR